MHSGRGQWLLPIMQPYREPDCHTVKAPHERLARVGTGGQRSGEVVGFHRGALELAEVEHWPPPRVATWLSIGRNAVLGLWPSASGGEGVAIAGSRGGSHVHFAIYVESGSLLDWQQQLQQAGLPVEGPIQFAHPNRSLFVADPDGNVVELADWTVDWAGEK